MGAGGAALSAAVRPDQRSRPQASATFRAGGLLALYTDGLIERRTEDIDTGLARLAESLVRHGSLDPESLADALLDDLTPAHGTSDDTALVVIRL
jgi:serine phosphatase RsbU (regulator of sigma subunit)